MKNLFLLTLLMMSFTLTSFAVDVTFNSPSINKEVVELTKYTVYGELVTKNIITTINSDGTSSTTIEMECDQSSSFICYTLELSPSGFTEIDPTGVESLNGILIDSDESNHWYKLQTNQ